MNPYAGRKANKLIESSSPYLLQHAYNPVEWYEWGTEALSLARKLDRPILVSIGYSACHWCHVMERESFENEDIAAIMNAHFVCIKVDREERPDVDHIYMEAIQAMQMHGGWPLNVFLTPSQVPFYGGTYFPPAKWAQLLMSLEKAFRERRAEIDQSADALKSHLQVTDVQRFAQPEETSGFLRTHLDDMVGILSGRFDATWGGIEKAPKFVLPSIWLFLLRYHAITHHQDAINMVTLTLKKMTLGGLYDAVGGGFSRYSVDGHWFAPHFEKMLYDNAQLLSLYAEAYAVTRDREFRKVMEEIVDWIEKEMISPDGGVYSALDADSEGMEGKYYTWTWEELTTLLEEPMLDYFGATREGNWEHGRNILCKPANLHDFCSNYQLKDGDLEHLLVSARGALAAERNARIRPGLDDKILAGWNAMLVHGLTDAYRAVHDERLLKTAARIMHFIETHHVRDGKLFRTYKEKTSSTEGFLEDYAWYIRACTDMYEVTFEENWLHKAAQWCTYTQKSFFDPGDGFFHFTSDNAEQLIARKKEIFDNVIPSSNSVMAGNLFRLGVILDKSDWVNTARAMVTSMIALTTAEPGSMSNWAIVLSEMTVGFSEVVLVGRQAKSLRADLHQHYLPFAVTLGTETTSGLPHFEGRTPADERTLIYVCRNKTCQLPVESVDAAIKQMKL